MTASTSPIRTSVFISSTHFTLVSASKRYACMNRIRTRTNTHRKEHPQLHMLASCSFLGPQKNSENVEQIVILARAKRFY